jgi:hypothetical protein
LITGRTYFSTRALRQTVADLVADDLVLCGDLFGAQTLHFGVGHVDGHHRHAGFVEEWHAGAVVDEVRRGLATLVRGHVLLGRGCWGWRRHQLAQVHLLRVGLRCVALALLAEDLALEPFDLRAQ